MAISKKLRQQVFDKYNGHCAYCGCELKKGWNVDHIKAFWHTVKPEDQKRCGIIKGDDCIENYNPSCPRCNKWKATFSIEQFREEISQQVARLREYSSNFRMAEDYGLVKESNAEVVFYFETINKQS